MIQLEVTKLFIYDLEEDFVRNKKIELYDFIKGDPVKAFWIGYHFKEWFDKLDGEKPYLYSKQARHIIDYIGPNEEQIHYWIDKEGKDESMTLSTVEYVLNNLILENEDDLDKIAFYFGTLFTDDD